MSKTVINMTPEFVMLSSIDRNPNSKLWFDGVAEINLTASTSWSIFTLMKKLLSTLATLLILSISFYPVCASDFGFYEGHCETLESKNLQLTTDADADTHPLHRHRQGCSSHQNCQLSLVNQGRPGIHLPTSNNTDSIPGISTLAFKSPVLDSPIRPPISIS